VIAGELTIGGLTRRFARPRLAPPAARRLPFLT
jgi:hypothetical protein